MKSLLGMWRPRALEGMAFNQSPACGRAEDIARARDLASGAESTRAWNVTSSMHRDKVFWRSGTSMSSSEDQEGWLVEWARSATADGVARGRGGVCPLISATRGRVSWIEER